MTESAVNRKRVFADVVSIDAWHPGFSARAPTVDLHADVVFRVARVGGEIESPIRFRLGLKRAELVLIIPPNEPVGIVKRTVARDQSLQKGKLKRSIKSKEGTRAGIRGKAKFHNLTPGFTVEADAHHSLDLTS